MKKMSVVVAINLLALTVLTYAGRPWFGFQEGLSKAQKEHKHVVIDFYTDWCHWCKVMDQKTFSDPEVEKFLFEHFVPIRINAEDASEKMTFQGKPFTARELTRAFQVTGYPSIAFLTETSEILGVVPGYIEKDKFLNLLKYVQSECYKTNVSFDDFLKGGCKPVKQPAGKSTK